MSQNTILALEDIFKVYPNGVIANSHASLSVNKGEIHALVGENGAGKSTLMKILFGIEQPTSGRIILDNKEVRIKNPLDAIEYGLGMVHQHFMLVESMSVAENITLGSEPVKGAFINKDEMINSADRIIKQFNFTINPNEKVRNLPIGTRQKVEILKALYKGAKILILDEPTAVLTPQETQELFKELKGLRDMGHTIIFISHKLHEIKELCDRITIMRGGATVGVKNVSDVTEEEISNLMVGKNIEWDIKKGPKKEKEIVLSVKDITVLDDAQKRVVSNLSFSLHGGTILGVVGIEGNGQNELIEVITGLRRADEGSVTLLNKDITSKKIKEIRRLGLSHVPQDRTKEGVALDSSILDNLFATYTEDERFTLGPFMKMKKLRAWASSLSKEYLVKANSIDVSVKMLSGGNMQKVVVAREFSSNSACIIANQPTRGIDVGAAKFIHERLISLRDEGAAILLVSADLAEVMDISDSLIVMHEGKINAYISDATTVTQEALGQYMLGLKRMSDEEIRGAVL